MQYFPVKERTKERKKDKKSRKKKKVEGPNERPNISRYSCLQDYNSLKHKLRISDWRVVFCFEKNWVKQRKDSFSCGPRVDDLGKPNSTDPGAGLGGGWWKYRTQSRMVARVAAAAGKRAMLKSGTLPGESDVENVLKLIPSRLLIHLTRPAHSSATAAATQVERSTSCTTQRCWGGGLTGKVQFWIHSMELKARQAGSHHHQGMGRSEAMWDEVDECLWAVVGVGCLVCSLNVSPSAWLWWWWGMVVACLEDV